MYLNYLPNTIFEIHDDIVEPITTPPITLYTELTLNNKIYELGKLSIYTHVNTGIVSMIASMDAFTQYFSSIAFRDDSLVKKIWLNLYSFF